MATKFVTSDARGRVTVAQPDREYLVREEADGTLILEPAVVVSELERRYMANAALQAQIEYARTHSEQRVSRKRRS